MIVTQAKNYSNFAIYKTLDSILVYICSIKSISFVMWHILEIYLFALSFILSYVTSY